MATYLTSIARPYAHAAFSYAKQHNELDAWNVFLENAASIVNDTSIAHPLASGKLSREQMQSLFESILASSLNDARRNFLKLLVQNKRVIFLPDIANQFKALLATHLKKANVRLVTAVEASDEFKANLTKHLSLKLDQEVELHCEKDPSLIGGAILYVNNKVIDNSVRGRLNRLLEFTLR